MKEKSNNKRYNLGLKDAYQRQRNGKQISLIVLAFLLGVASLGFAVRAFHRNPLENRPSEPFSTSLPVTPAPAGQATAPAGTRQKTYLARNIEIDKFRRLLGTRFLFSGKDTAVLTGTLTIDGQSSAVRIDRQQTDNDEKVAIAFNGGPASLGYSGKGGARLSGASPNSAQRKLIERIALDSPDQFILAQLRGVTYKTIARNVVPQGAGSIEDYTGPSWTVIHVGEIDELGERKNLSGYRLYYFNTTTGLLDKVVSQEGNDYVMADFSNWTYQDGERLPTKVVWTINKQAVMELTINAATYAH